MRARLREMLEDNWVELVARFAVVLCYSIACWCFYRGCR